MRRLSISLVLVPALALAQVPKFDTLVSVRVDDDRQELDIAVARALTAVGSRADTCWHKAGHLRATIGLDDGKVTSVDVKRLDDKSAKDCVITVLTAVALGGAAGHAVVEVDLEAQRSEPRVALFDEKNRKTIDAILDRDLSTSLSKFNGIKGDDGTGGGGVGTRVGPTSPNVAVGPLEQAPPPEGDLSADAINRVMRAHAGVFRACYQKELGRDPKLAGKVVLRFTIKPDGSTTNVAVASTTLKSPAVETCLVNQVERLKFPAKTLANVSYPFVFAQGG